MNKRPYFLSTMFITFLITTPTLSSMSQESQSVANDISFNAIPDEILSRIFSFALKNNQDNPKTMPELRREIQNIKLVCKRWNLWLDDVLPSVLLSPGTVPGYEGNNETGYSAPTV